MPFSMLILAVFLVAACYSSVGLGGGTAYLSVISVLSSDPEVLRPTAWSLNVLAATVTFGNFFVRGHFRPCEAWPWVAGGISGAFFGAMLPIEVGMFQGLLGVTLSAVAAHMLLCKGNGSGELGKSDARRPIWLVGMLLGTVVGVISGVVGIGGGIILGPVILTFNLGEEKPTAALTSLYILLSSAAALSSHVLQDGSVDLELIVVLAAAVVVGSFIGSKFGAGRASPTFIRRTFGVLVLAAGVRLLVMACG